MSATYPTRYADRNGVEAAELHNDGKALAITLRGVKFSGDDFDALEPVTPDGGADLSSFQLNHGCLCSCVLDFDMPIDVFCTDKFTRAVLSVHLELGGTASTEGIAREILKLHILINGRSYASSGSSGWFEDELLDLAKQIEPEWRMRACISCAFSDYSPYGHGLFGRLACFRDNKPGYSTVRSKRGIFEIWDTMTEFVQETYVCPEFEIRHPGTGYRG